MVLGVCNDIQGYAPDRAAAQRGGCAADQVPLMQGRLPFANLHDELVKELLSFDAVLSGYGDSVGDVVGKPAQAPDTPARPEA